MSSNLKRKREQEQESDEEDPTPGRQILPVATLPDDYSGPIMDGLQYLFTVRRDARRLPHVTRVVNPYEVPQILKPALSNALRHPSVPSDEWREVFEKRLKNFRKNLGQPTTHVHQPPVKDRKQKILPDKNDRDSWWAFIAGAPEDVWNTQKRPKNQKGKQAAQQENGDVREEAEVQAALSDGLLTPRMTPMPTGESSASRIPPSSDNSSSPALKPREPSPSLLAHIDHRLSIHVLIYFTNWINHYLRHPEDVTRRLTETHARWMFALLTRVQDHVSADDMSLLRNLARACTALLKEYIWKRGLLVSAGMDPDLEAAVSTDAMGERSCWMIVAAVVGVWGQRDTSTCTLYMLPCMSCLSDVWKLLQRMVAVFWLLLAASLSVSANLTAFLNSIATGPLFQVVRRCPWAHALSCT